MTIQGNLNEIALPSILQILCAEQRHVVIHLRRHGEEGVVFLGQGNILHAEFGELKGQDALYDLLTWEDGAFHVGEPAEVPRDSIGLSVDHLLLEGARKQDEKPQLLTLSHTEARIDRAIELDLMELLSKAENQMSLLRAKRVKRRPTRAFAILEGILNDVLDFAKSGLGKQSLSVTIAEALAVVGKEYPQMRHLRMAGNYASLGHLSALYSEPKGDLLSRQSLGREIRGGFVALLTFYFSELEGVLPSATTAERWKASYRVLLRELSSVLESIPV